MNRRDLLHGTLLTTLAASAPASAQVPLPDAKPVPRMQVLPLPDSEASIQREGVELTRYIIFFFPGVISLMYSGWGYGYDSMRIREMSINSPVGIPIWQIKMLIPVGGALIALQGVAEVMRCIVCLRDGKFAPRLHDVEELEKQILEEAARGGIEAAKAVTGAVR